MFFLLCFFFLISHVDLSLLMMMITFFFFLNLSFLLFVSCPSTHLNLFVCAVSHSAGGFSVQALLSLWVVDRRSRGGGWGRGGEGGGSLAAPWSRLGDLMLCDRLAVQSGPLSPLYAAVVTLFDPFWKLHYSPVFVFYRTAGTTTTSV